MRGSGGAVRLLMRAHRPLPAAAGLDRRRLALGILVALAGLALVVVGVMSSLIWVGALGFLAMVALRSLGLIPEALLAPLATLATFLTIVSMAALGLGVDVRTVAKAGGPVTATVVLSLVLLGAISFALLVAIGFA